MRNSLACLRAVDPALTLLVIARNEAAAIGRCLDSVPFAAEKLVVDSGSTDGTPEVAARHGARVVHQDWLGFGPQRNFASTQASHDWILTLDADEALSAGARARNAATPAAAHAVARAPARSCGGRPGTWARRCAGIGRWSASAWAALYHRGRARWTDVRVHESLRFDGADGRRSAHPFIHLNNPTLVHKHLKTLRYAELKARDWLDRGKPVQMWMTPFVFLAAFIKDYFLRLAFLDGWRGYVVAQVAASYAVYKRMRYYEMKRNPASRELAAELLRGYGLDP